MKVISDKKSNLARGFADINTPSEVHKELLFSWQERKLYLQDRISKLTELASNEIDKKKKAVFDNELLGARKSLHALSVKINKRVDLHSLMIDRFRQICTPEQFVRVCAQAKLDKAEILKSFHVTGEE